MIPKQNDGAGLTPNKGTAPTNINKEDKSKDMTEKVINKDIDDIISEVSYRDDRSMTVHLIKNKNKFREANRKAIQDKIDYIGSSINSTRQLSASTGEVNKYFPAILSVGKDDSKFTEKVNQYFNNIKIAVPPAGLKLDVSFVYDKKSYYDDFAKKEEYINEVYSKADKSNIKKFKDAINEKVKALHKLESEKYAYGTPVNIDDYIAYRHCLLYPHVAKDTLFSDSLPSIRFYFKDDVREAKRIKDFNKAKVDSLTNLANVYQSDELINDMYIISMVKQNRSLGAYSGTTLDDKRIALDKFRSDNPVKFNSLYADKELKNKAFIELAISKGFLTRIPNTQNITTINGEYVGGNTKEAIAWIKNPKNTAELEKIKLQIANM